MLALDCPLVEITGGEPLLQKNVLPLLSLLCNADRTVLSKPAGHDISKIDPRVHRIMDLRDTFERRIFEEPVFEHLFAEPS